MFFLKNIQVSVNEKRRFTDAGNRPSVTILKKGTERRARREESGGASPCQRSERERKNKENKTKKGNVTFGIPDYSGDIRAKSRTGSNSNSIIRRRIGRSTKNSSYWECWRPFLPSFLTSSSIRKEEKLFFFFSFFPLQILVLSRRCVRLFFEL
jgi:hypothetical protein